MSTKKILIFPFNGNGIEALDCLDINKFDFVGFIDDDTSKKSDDYEIFTRSILDRNRDFFILAVPGSPTSFSSRSKIISSLNLPLERFTTVIHPNAHIGNKVKLGANCLVMAGAVVTSNAQIGNHVCLLPNTVIHHDVRIGDYTLVGSNVVVAGGTVIKENCYIGSGCNVINGIEIGARVLVGLGSNVTKSIPFNDIVVGNPAKSIYTSKSKEDDSFNYNSSP